MYHAKCNAISTYLRNELTGVRIEQAWMSRAQHYIVYLDDDSRILKVHEEFFSDNTEDEIVSKMESWQVANLLKESDSIGVVVTDSGLIA